MRISFRAFALAGALLCSTITNAGLSSWTVAGPGGGWATVVAANPAQPAIVLAGTAGGMFRSTDGGASWVRIESPMGSPNNITFDPADATRVFAGNTYLISSSDSGQTFTTLPVSRQPPVNGVREVWFNRDGSYLFVSVGSARIFRTANLGTDWTEVTGQWPTGSETLTTFAVDPNDANILYAAVTGSGVYKSINAGASWALTGAGPGSGVYLVNQIAIKPGDSNRVAISANDGLYVSANGGAIWSHPYPYGTSSIAFDPAASQNVSAINYEGSIMRSADSGDTFPGLGATLRMHFQLRRLHYVPAVPNKIFVASGDGPLLSTDGGTSFQPAVSGIRAESLAALSMSDDGTAYAVFSQGPGGVFKRTPTGWQEANRTGSYIAGIFALGYRNHYMTDVAVARQNPNFVYAIFTNDSIVKSTDGGANWIYAGSPLLGGMRQLRKLTIDPSNVNVAYVASATDGVWKTTDGGQNWIKQSSGLPNAITALAIDRANPQIVYAGTSAAGSTSVYKTINGGTSWSPTGTLPASFPQAITIDPSDSNVVYVSLPLALHKSTNAGGNWTPIADARPSRSLDIDAALPTTLLSGLTTTPGGFSRSVDGGAIWEHVDVPPSLAKGMYMVPYAMDPTRSGRVITGGHGTGILEYEVAPDLDIALNAPGPTLQMGSTFNATVRVRNLGPMASSASTLRVTLPAWATPVPPAGCTLATITLTCQIAAFRVTDAPRDIVIPLTAATNPAAGTIDAQLTTHETDAVPANNTASTPLASIAVSDLGVTTAGGGLTLLVNSAVTFTVTASNAGPTSAPNTRVTLQAPANVTIQSATSTIGTCVTAGATVTCNLNSLASAANATITFNGTAVTAGSAAFTATVAGDTSDAVAANNSATTTFTISSPPPASSSSSSSSGGGGGGGGRFDWLAVFLLASLAWRRFHVVAQPKSAWKLS